MEQVLKTNLRQKLEEAEVDTVDRVFDDIKDFVKNLPAEDREL